MDFKIEKKGYLKTEVDDYVAHLVKDYSQTAYEQKQLLSDLKQQLSEAEKKIKNYKDKESLVSKALTSAVAKADEIDKLAQLKYSREMEQLKAFHDKWLSYYDKILRKYPLNDELASASKFNDEMSSILKKAEHNAVEAASEETSDENNLRETRIGYVNITTDDSVEDDDDLSALDFDPVERIRTYLTREKPKKTSKPTEQSSVSQAAASDFSDRSASGFSFEEALNPKQDLEDIMRDLGLLMEDR